METQAVIRSIIESCRHLGMLTPLKTRLVKLIYLAELEYYRRTGKRLTDLDWKFHHYGPYAPALSPYLGNPEVDAIDFMLEQILQKNEHHGERDHEFQAVLNEVVKEWGDADLNALLDYVYFDTEPMENAARGDFLDFSTVSRKPSPRIAIHLDPKKIKSLRKRVSDRAGQYEKLRQASVAEDSIFGNLLEWDAERSVSLAEGPCFIDPDQLKKRE